MTAVTAVWSAPTGPQVATVRTTEQGEPCPACKMIVTNSQPDCRCS